MMRNSLFRCSLLIALSLASGWLIVGTAQITAPPVFLLKWGVSGSGPGQFSDPEGVAISPDGRVYVLDTETHRVQVFDANGKYQFEWGTFCDLGSGKGCQNPNGEGQFKEPEGIAVGSEGTIYVADSGNDRIEVFDSEGHFRARWGSSGSSDGQLSNPVGLALDNQGNLYVADTLNHRMEVLDASGAFVRAWGSKGSAEGQFLFPSGVAVDPESNLVYVTDNGNDRIERFDLQGHFLDAWGSLCALIGDDQTPAGTGCQLPQGEGQFKLPFGIALDKLGNVYVVDQGNRRIEVFNAMGHFLVQWGTPCNVSSGTGCVDPDGSGPLERGDGQFLSPKGIALAADSTIYVADSDNNRVQAFRFSQ